MIRALKVSRSTTAAARRGSVKVWPHSLKGALEATAMEAFSSRSVMTWNSSSVPLGQRADANPFIAMLTSDTFKQLHPRHLLLPRSDGVATTERRDWGSGVG